METEVSGRTSRDGLIERTVSRSVSVGAALIAVAAVVGAILSTGAGSTAKNLGVVVAVASGGALVVFGFVGRGSLLIPIWMLAFLSALCTLSLSEGDTVDGGSSRALSAGLLGLAIVVVAVTSQFASDRRFATPIMPGQLQISARTILLQVGSGVLGLVAVPVVFLSEEAVSYWWFFAGLLGLVGLLVAMAAGLRR